MTAPATSELIRLAIVGAGVRSKLGLHAFESGLGRVVAVADPSPAGRDRAAAMFPGDVSVLTSHRELAHTDVDAALISSPDDTHAEIAIDLLRAGIAVYVEKPLAIVRDNADAILHAAYDTGTKLYVGHNMRHMAVIRLMREIIARGDIGEPKAVWCRHFVGSGGDFYFKDWHADRSRSTGLLLQKGAHDIDVIHWLAGGYSTDVVAMGDLSLYGQIEDRQDNSDRLMTDWYSLETWPPLTQTALNPVVDVEDISMMMMRLDNGVLASYQQCHFTPDYWRNYTVIGTEGRLENFGDTEGGVVKVWNSRTTWSPDGDQQHPIIGDAGGHGDADLLTMTEFLRFVGDGAPTETSPVAARNSVVAGIAATESLRDGSTPRAVEPLAPELLEYFAGNQVRPTS